MKLSTKTRYSLRILLHIALESKRDGLASGKDIASSQGINEPYLEQIMSNLKSAGFVKTVRGRNGGYKLAKKAEEISLLNIIEAIEGELNLSEGDEQLSRESKAAERIWQKMSNKIKIEARSLTLFRIINEELIDQSDYII